LQEEQPAELTLCYQHAQKEALSQKRMERKTRSRWNRLAFALHAKHVRKNRHMALHELATLRAVPIPTSTASLPCNERHHTPGTGLANGSDFALSAEDEVVLAAQLGMDVATYRMLRSLEQREILPEDYELLGRLDDAVQARTLSSEQLNRFELKLYSVAEVPTSSNSCAGLGMDFWRLPMPALLSDETISHNECSFGMDFWRLPLLSLDDIVTADTVESRHCSKRVGTLAEVCGVCLVEFDQGVELRVLPCGHQFHRECIDHWLTQSSTLCPVDKRDLRFEP
jgi:hypothetical protein